MRYALPIALSIAATASSAQFTRTSAAGHEYALTCNANGYILRSVHPVSRFIGQGGLPSIHPLNVQFTERCRLLFDRLPSLQEMSSDEQMIAI